MSEEMVQKAPWPQDLADIVAQVEYKPTWSFELVEGERNDNVSGLTLLITERTLDAHKYKRGKGNGKGIDITYPFSVPAVIHSREGWIYWLWECIADAEAHERGEWFKVDGERPFAPRHVPEADGYRII